MQDLFYRELLIVLPQIREFNRHLEMLKNKTGKLSERQI